jgi:HlyD family secretion protein
VLEVEKQSRTVEVEADFSNPKDYHELLAGYSADLEIVLDTHNDVLRIPTEALLTAQDGQHRVLIYDDSDQLLHERNIEIGLSNWKLTEVVSGLSAGEKIVVSIDREGVKAGALATVEQP